MKIKEGFPKELLQVCHSTSENQEKIWASWEEIEKCDSLEDKLQALVSLADFCLSVNNPVVAIKMYQETIRVSFDEQAPLQNEIMESARYAARMLENMIDKNRKQFKLCVKAIDKCYADLEKKKKDEQKKNSSGGC